MIISILSNSFNIPFIGCKDLLKEVDIDFYTGKFVPKKFRSTEHIKPKSKGGRNNILNYAMSDRQINSERGNMSLDKWIKIHPDYLQNMKNYVKKYWNIKILGVNHGEEVNNTVKKISNIDLLG